MQIEADSLSVIVIIFLIMADLDKIKKQVIDLLNANEFDVSGVKQYSTTSGDEDFLDESIARAITEAQTIVAERICLSDNSTLKTPFILSNQAITHGSLIPVHYGNVFNIKITPYDGASFTLRGQKRNPELISSYRANPDNIYGEFGHDEEDEANNSPSQLAGFYSDEHNLFEFTGESATISYADINISITNFPTSLEVPITHIAVGLLAKDGSVSNKFGEHMAIGLGLLGDTIADKKEDAE